MTTEEITACREGHLETWVSLQPDDDGEHGLQDQFIADPRSAQDLGIPSPHPFSKGIPAPGEIRLLSFSKTPNSNRPVFVAVLGPWSDSLVTVTPFSLWPVPALPGELLLLPVYGPLNRVLCSWNTRNVPAWSLQESWITGLLEPEDLLAARRLFRSTLLAQPVETALLARTGPDSPGKFSALLEKYFFLERGILGELQRDALLQLKASEFLSSLGSISEDSAAVGDLFDQETQTTTAVFFQDLERRLPASGLAFAGSAKVPAAVLFQGSGEELIARLVGHQSTPTELFLRLPIEEIAPLHHASEEENRFTGQWRILSSISETFPEPRGFLIVDPFSNWKIIGRGIMTGKVATLTGGDFAALDKAQAEPSQLHFVFHL